MTRVRVSRPGHSLTVCPVVQWRGVMAHAGSSRARIDARAIGVVVASLCNLICMTRSLTKVRQKQSGSRKAQTDEGIFDHSRVEQSATTSCAAIRFDLECRTDRL
jgi:hypothetical protein